MVSVNSLTRATPLLSVLVSSSPKGRFHSELKSARQLILAGLVVVAAIRLFSHFYPSKKQMAFQPGRVSDNSLVDVLTVARPQSSSLLTPPATPPKVAASQTQGFATTEDSPSGNPGSASSSSFTTPPITPPKESSSTPLMHLVANFKIERERPARSEPLSPIRSVPEGQIPRTSLVKRLEGSLNQFEFLGKGDNACTIICMRFLELVLGAELSFDGLAPMMNEILKMGIDKYQRILTENPKITQQLGSNPALSPCDINLSKYYPSITSSKPLYTSISEDAASFFGKLVKDALKMRSSALITCRDYTYAIAINPENGEFLFYDSHGEQKIKSAYVLCFSSSEKLAYHLAQRFPFNKTESYKNNLLFFPVRAT